VFCVKGCNTTRYCPVLVQLSRPAALNEGLLPNVYGRKLFTSSDFWLLCSILSLCTFLPLPFLHSHRIYVYSKRDQVDVYVHPRVPIQFSHAKQNADINNVGSMAQTLYFSGRNQGYDPIEAAGWQASQVSMISLMNFSGRIFIGTSSLYLLSIYSPLITYHTGLGYLQTPILLLTFLLPRTRLSFLSLADRSRLRR
jgi:hypothetical protein